MIGWQPETYSHEHQLPPVLPEALQEAIKADTDKDGYIRARVRLYISAIMIINGFPMFSYQKDGWHFSIGLFFTEQTKFTNSAFCVWTLKT